MQIFFVRSTHYFCSHESVRPFMLQWYNVSFDIDFMEISLKENKKNMTTQECNFFILPLFLPLNLRKSHLLKFPLCFEERNQYLILWLSVWKISWLFFFNTRSISFFKCVTVVQNQKSIALLSSLKYSFANSFTSFNGHPKPRNHHPPTRQKRPMSYMPSYKRAKLYPLEPFSNTPPNFALWQYTINTNTYLPLPLLTV